MQLSDADFEAAFSEAQKEIQEEQMGTSAEVFGKIGEPLNQEEKQERTDFTQKVLDRMAEDQAQKFFADNQLLHSDGTYMNGHPDQNINTDRPGLFDMSQRIGSDAIDYTEQKDRSAEQDARDADDLARTAGQLLTSVQHDSSNKFRESRFLDLMRRIRDREVEVKGEDFVDTPEKGNENYISPIYSNISNEWSMPAAYETEDALHANQSESFNFPDLNEVYNPQHTDGKTEADYHFDTHNTSSSTPQNQIQELHPGGRLYPEQSPPPTNNTMMSGGISTSYQPPTVEDAASG